MTCTMMGMSLHAAWGVPYRIMHVVEAVVPSWEQSPLEDLASTWYHPVHLHEPSPLFAHPATIEPTPFMNMPLPAFPPSWHKRK